MDGRGPAELVVDAGVVPGAGPGRGGRTGEGHHLVLLLVVDVHVVVDEQLVGADRALLLGRAAANLKSA